MLGVHRDLVETGYCRIGLACHVDAAAQCTLKFLAGMTLEPAPQKVKLESRLLANITVVIFERNLFALFGIPA